jgi:hypothetical protein
MHASFYGYFNKISLIELQFLGNSIRGFFSVALNMKLILSKILCHLVVTIINILYLLL